MPRLDWPKIWSIPASVPDAMQNQFEFAHALRLAAEADVQVMLEIGSASGASLRGWQRIATDVFSLTLRDSVYGTPEDSTATVGYFDSHTKEARDWLTKQLDGRKLDLLFIDGDHSAAGCEADFNDYSPFVKPGGLIMFHDIVFDDGVIEFWGKLDMPKREIISPFDRPIGIGVVQKT